MAAAGPRPKRPQLASKNNPTRDRTTGFGGGPGGYGSKGASEEGVNHRSTRPNQQPRPPTPMRSKEALRVPIRRGGGFWFAGFGCRRYTGLWTSNQLPTATTSRGRRCCDPRGRAASNLYGEYVEIKVKSEQILQYDLLLYLKLEVVDGKLNWRSSHSDEEEEKSRVITKVKKVVKHAKEKKVVKGASKPPPGARKSMRIATNEPKLIHSPTYVEISCDDEDEEGEQGEEDIEIKDKEQASKVPQPKDVVPNPRLVHVPPPTVVPIGSSGFGGFSSFVSSSSSFGSQKDPSMAELKEKVGQLKERMARMLEIQEGTDARLGELLAQVGALVSVIQEMGSGLQQLNTQVTTRSSTILQNLEH
ncbi:hypothetical protein SOVF_096790 [Spinacia oleracea]|nr:hypothetical protein SOVF_096790 [Spinacia oleracea]